MRRQDVLALVALLLVAALPGCRASETEAPSVAAPRPEIRVPRTITLFFESPSLVLLPEAREVDLPEMPGLAAASVLTELFRGPSDESLTRLFPEDTAVRAVYFLPDGMAVVDVGGATLSAGWDTGSHIELMAVYSLVQTVVTNFDGVRKVRILVNGQPHPSLAGHVAIDRFLGPSPALIGRR